MNWAMKNNKRILGEPRFPDIPQEMPETIAAQNISKNFQEKTHFK